MLHIKTQNNISTRKKQTFLEIKKTGREIMESSEAAKAKSLSKKIFNFSQSIWNTHCQEIGYEAAFIKCSENLILKEYLLPTGNKKLVEAPPPLLTKCRELASDWMTQTF